MKKYLLITLMLGFCFSSIGQTLSGKVETSTGPAIGATLSAGDGKGTVTDENGSYSLNLSAGTYTIEVSYVGYKSQSFTVTLASGANETKNIFLEEDEQALGEVIVVGSRNAARSSTDTPLPVDVLPASSLTATGQNSFDKALQYRVPSFNTVQTPVNDATSLLDPYEIRNLGPSRTLVLINGKRKNLSALLYTQTSPGRGESGADISAIPVDAIKRVEILRDGASAQYGSDAIAGVMNIILKDNIDNGAITFRTGITGAGDGAEFGLSVNNGVKLGGKGSLNYTVDLSKRYLANRPGTVSAEGEARAFGADIADVRAFLAKKPDAGNINGSPETTAAKFALNGGIDLGSKNEMYFNAAYVYKKVNSFANYRTPYWRTKESQPFLATLLDPGREYDGYVPTFDGDLGDYNATFGFKTVKNGWNIDASVTVGGNQQTYTIRNSVNRRIEDARLAATRANEANAVAIDSARAFNDRNADAIAAGTLQPKIDLTEEVIAGSPLTHRAGGTRFSHVVGNVDISKPLTKQIGLAFGSEFRSETFETIEGDRTSYYLGGPDSFAGNSDVNSFISNRYNVGVYLDLAFDITDDFLINATARGENYSDFGDAFVYKLSSRYKLLDDKVTLRASYSTGFRAPTLHQIYTQKAQYSFSGASGGIAVEGLLNNVSTEANTLGIPKLQPEKSTNFTVGLGIKPNKAFSITLDYYSIDVKDRIVLGNNISPTGDDTKELDRILNAGGITALSFFTNALDTRTSGIDFVLDYKTELAGNDLRINLLGNYMLQNERVGDVRNVDVVADAGQSVLNITQEALMFTSRPEFKAILGFDYKVDKFSFGLYNTLFGPTSFRNADLGDNVDHVSVDFKTKVVTDLSVSYDLSEKTNIILNVNNVLNVLPEWEFVAHSATGEALIADAAQVKIMSDDITFNQRYTQMTYDGYHFSQLGTLLNLAIRVKL